MAGLEAILAVLSILAILAVYFVFWQLLAVKKVPVMGKVVGKTESLIKEQEYFTPLPYIGYDPLIPALPVMIEKTKYYLIIDTSRGLIPGQTKVAVALEVWLQYQAGDYFRGEVKAA